MNILNGNPWPTKHYVCGLLSDDITPTDAFIDAHFERNWVSLCDMDNNVIILPSNLVWTWI